MVFHVHFDNISNVAHTNILIVLPKFFFGLRDSFYGINIIIIPMNGAYVFVFCLSCFAELHNFHNECLYLPFSYVTLFPRYQTDFWLVKILFSYIFEYSIGNISLNKLTINNLPYERILAIAETKLKYTLSAETKSYFYSCLISVTWHYCIVHAQRQLHIGRDLIQIHLTVHFFLQWQYCEHIQWDVTVNTRIQTYLETYTPYQEATDKPSLTRVETLTKENKINKIEFYHLNSRWCNTPFW